MSEDRALSPVLFSFKSESLVILFGPLTLSGVLCKSVTFRFCVNWGFVVKASFLIDPR